MGLLSLLGWGRQPDPEARAYLRDPASNPQAQAGLPLGILRRATNLASLPAQTAPQQQWRPRAETDLPPFPLHTLSHEGRNERLPDVVRPNSMSAYDNPMDYALDRYRSDNPQPTAPAGMLQPPLAATPGAGRPARPPAAATERLRPEYVAARGPVTYTAHYRAQPLPNGSALRTSEPRFDPIPAPPRTAFEPIEAVSPAQRDEEAWAAALARARSEIAAARGKVLAPTVQDLLVRAVIGRRPSGAGGGNRSSRR